MRTKTNMSRLVIKKKTEPKTEWVVEGCVDIVDATAIYRFDTKAEAIAGFYEQIGRKSYDYVNLIERCSDGCEIWDGDIINEWERVREEDLKQEEPCDRCPSESLSYCMSNGCEEEKQDHWGSNGNGDIVLTHQTESYMNNHFDEWGYLDNVEDSRKIDRQTTEEMIAERNWEEESHRAIDWVFEGWDDDDVEECDKDDPGAVAVYFRKKKPE